MQQETKYNKEYTLYSKVPILVRIASSCILLNSNGTIESNQLPVVLKQFNHLSIENHEKQQIEDNIKYKYIDLNKIRISQLLMQLIISFHHPSKVWIENLL